MKRQRTNQMIKMLLAFTMAIVTAKWSFSFRLLKLPHAPPYYIHSPSHSQPPIIRQL